MNKEQHIESRLWDFIDGIISNEERIEILQLLEENIIWKQKYEEILNLNQSIFEMGIEEPSMRFNINVMDSIKNIKIAPTSIIYINKNIIWGIGFFFITIILGLLIYSFGLVEWNFGATNSFNIPINIPKIEYSFFSSSLFKNSFLMLNAVLGLMLFDHFLTSRKKTHI